MKASCKTCFSIYRDPKQVQSNNRIKLGYLSNKYKIFTDILPPVN